MLTRLKIKGFKNLVDVEVHLGPLTVIAGPNGAGKSNLFDAIHLLSLLADWPFMKAAGAVRGGMDPRDLFTVGGDGRIEIECDVLIPREGIDDFGQPVRASCTFLTYSLGLRYEERGGPLGVPRIALDHEALSCVEGDAEQRLGFETSSEWLASVIRDSTRRTAFIATEGDHVLLRDDRTQVGGGPRGTVWSFNTFEVARLPRTVLSSAQTAEEHSTAVLLRQEMKRWRHIQLEPSALRRPDDFDDVQGLPLIEPSGAHVAATLYRLAASANDPEDVYVGISNRLTELVDGVDSIRVDRDEGRRQFRLMVKDRYGVELPASSLSDGTLRFVVLAVMQSDPHTTGLVCLEEPENGLHPQRMSAMLRLLEHMAVDPSEPVDETNPLRQVVVSTHSPVVVANASAEDVVFAFPVIHDLGDRAIRGFRLRGLEGTWRAEPGEDVAKGSVLGYLAASQTADEDEDGDRARHRVRDVVDREVQRIVRSRKVQ